MTRDELEFSISQYLDGTLPPEERAALERRLESDPEARATLDEFRALDAALKDAPLPAFDWTKVSTSISAAVEQQQFVARSVEPADDEALEQQVVALIEGRLSAGHARAIATTPNVEELAERIVRDGMTVRQAEAMAHQNQAGGKEDLARKRRQERGLYSADTAALQQDLADALGLDVQLKDRGGKGELTVKYATLEQLDDLCRRLMRSDRGGL